MKCPRCGTENADNAVFCMQCRWRFGAETARIAASAVPVPARLEAAAAMPPQKKKRRSKSALIIVFGVAAVILVLCAMFAVGAVSIIFFGT